MYLLPRLERSAGSLAASLLAPSSSREQLALSTPSVSDRESLPGLLPSFFNSRVHSSESYTLSSREQSFPSKTSETRRVGTATTMKTQLTTLFDYSGHAQRYSKRNKLTANESSPLYAQ